MDGKQWSEVVSETPIYLTPALYDHMAQLGHDMGIFVKTAPLPRAETRDKHGPVKIERHNYQDLANKSIWDD